LYPRVAAVDSFQEDRRRTPHDRRRRVCSIRPGGVGEASILELKNGKFDYVDVVGERMIGDWRLEARGIVLNGQLWNG
jgi:dihydroorotase